MFDAFWNVSPLSPLSNVFPPVFVFGSLTHLRWSENFVAWSSPWLMKRLPESHRLSQAGRRSRTFWTTWSSRLDCPWLGERKRTSGMKRHFAAPLRIFTWKRKRHGVLCCRSCTFLMNLDILFVLLALYRITSWRKAVFLYNCSC